MINVSAMLSLYREGRFPMGDPDTGEVFVVDPDPRTVIPLEGFHASKTLAQRLRSNRYPVTFDKAFSDVVSACAERPRKWITPDLETAYAELFRRGVAHSAEAWKEGQLAGGVFGLAVGAAFVGESMFHRFTDAGMVALASLIERLREKGYALFDVQFLTPHLKRSGAVEVTRAEYQRRLAAALRSAPPF